MGDVANGIKSFKKGMQDDESDGSKPDDSKQAQVNTDHRLSEPLAQPAHRSDSPV